VRIVLFSNTTVNFFAYIIAHQDFRKAVKKIFCRQSYLARKRSLALKGSLNSPESGGSETTPSKPSEQGTMVTSVSAITLTLNNMEPNPETTMA
jgi:hypothetical protein